MRAMACPQEQTRPWGAPAQSSAGRGYASAALATSVQPINMPLSWLIGA